MRVALLVAVALAGCVTTGPSTSPPGEFPPTPTPPEAQMPRVESMELANGTVSIGPGEAKVGVWVPARAIDVAYYLTLESGATVGLTGDLNGCVRRVDGTLFPGQTAGKSCGALPAGGYELLVRHDAGRATIRVVVNATVRA